MTALFKNKKTFALLFLLALFVVPLSVLASELDSTNYKIVGATTQGGGIAQTVSGNYSVLLGIGGISSDPRIYSTSYKVGTSPETPFQPAIPIISCFETTTNGASACRTGPTALKTGGMTAICGTGGCYNKARFEISDSPYRYSTNDSRLVSYWPMDEPINDSCPSGEDVCDVKGPSNGIATGTSIVDGFHSKSRSFNGTSDFINVGRHSSLDLSSKGTISLWVKSNRTYPSNDGTTRFRGILDKSTSGGAGGQSYYIDWYGTNSSRILRARIVNGASVQGFTISNYDMGTNWKHIVLTFDGSNLRLYIDGGLVGTTTQTISAQYLNTDVNIGRAFQAAHHWDGLIDEVMIFNEGLNQSEVEALYNSQASVVNPPDTLYAIAISTDNFVSDLRYLDASTFFPESANSHNIHDFMTKSAWETETFNARGLDINTTYYLRAFALKGDFTQTDFGPIKSAITAVGSLFFDIDVAGSTGYTTENSPPYSISFTGAYRLLAGLSAVTAENRIWMDAETNSGGGFAIVMSGQYGGLYSPTTTQTITSATANLDSVLSGFGLQSEYIDYDNSSPFFGDITATANYSGSLNSVGIVSTTHNKVYDGNGPIVGGRLALRVIAKPGNSHTPSNDYQETITLIFVPRY